MVEGLLFSVLEISVPAIPESLAVLAAGAGLVLIAFVLRRIGKRAVKNANLELQHVTEQN